MKIIIVTLGISIFLMNAAMVLFSPPCGFLRCHRKKDVPGVQGPTTFDAKGQANKEVMIVQWHDGQRRYCIRRRNNPVVPLIVKAAT